MKTTIKALLCALIFLLHTTPLAADMVTDGLKKAKAQDKEVVVYCYSQYCQYCDAMDKNVLNDKEIGAILNKDMVYIRADMDKRPDLAKKYQIRGYPTTILMDRNGKIIAKIPGYIPKKDFRKILSYLKGKHYKMMSLEDFLGSRG